MAISFRLSPPRLCAPLRRAARSAMIVRRGVPNTQQLGHRPRLRDATARGEGCVAIKYLANGPQSVGINLPAQRIQVTQRGIAIAINAQMREHVRTEQPAPRGSLMVSAIARKRVSAVVALIPWLARRETAQSVRSEQLLRAHVDHAFLLFAGERADGKRNGKDLVGPQRTIRADARRIDQVVTAAARGIPEFCKAGGGLRFQLFVTFGRFYQHAGKLDH